MQIILEAFVVGLITLVVGNIVFRLVIDKSKYKNNKYYKKNIKNINKSFFIIGVIIHILLEIVGINKWYCDKKICNKYHMLAKII